MLTFCMRRYLYSLAYLVLLGLPALLLSFFVKEILNPIHIIVVIMVCLFVGGIFDIWAVKQGKKDRFYVWEYNPKSIIGPKIMGVPIEDFVLFLLLTPLFIIIVWETVKKIFSNNVSIQPAHLALAVVITVTIYKFVYKSAKNRK